MKPPYFKGDKEPIVAQRWISDVEGSFCMWSCPEDQKVKFALNLLRSGAKDSWEFVSQSFFSCTASHSDLGVVSGDVPSGVCSTCGERATDTRVLVARVDDRVIHGDHWDVLARYPFLPIVCCFKAC